MDQPLDERDAARASDRARDTQLVLAIRAGDANAFGQLYDHWFDRVYDLASRIVRDPEVAAEVAQDTFLKAWRSLDSLENPDSFGGWLLRIARNAAYNRSEREGRSSAVDDQGLAVIESVGASPVSAPAGFGVEDRLGRAATPGAALEDGEAVALVWDAARALPERDLEVLDLQLRHGLTPAEIGEVMGMNRNAANQLVHRLKGRLETAIRARVLWRGGEPACPVLATRLREAGIAAFGGEAVRVVERHVPGCAECDERQRLRLQPAALFAATPLMIAPLVIKAQATAALGAAGVPMQGSVLGAAIVSAGPGAAGAGGSGSGAGPAGGGPGSVQPTGATLGGSVQPVSGVALGSAVQATGAGGASHLVRNALLAAAAVVVVVGALVGLNARTRNGTVNTELSATAAAPRSTTTVPPGSTAVSTTSTTTTASTVVTSTAPAPTAPGPTNPPPTDTTTAPSTTTTRPTTTTTAPVDATLTINRATTGTPYTIGVSLRVPSPTLTWNVVTTGQVTVAVEGPEGTDPKKLLASQKQGTYAVCPGPITNTKGQICNAPVGTYTYTLTVYGTDGKAITTKSVTLTVQSTIN